MNFLRKKKNLLLFLLAVFSLVTGLLCFMFNPYYWFMENAYPSVYDWKHPQKPVTTITELEEVLKQFKQVPYEKLDTQYLRYSKSDEAKYKTILATKSYYLVNGEDRYRYLVGNFRVKDFMAKDQFYFHSLLPGNSQETQYFLVDKLLLYALLDLQTALEKGGFDKKAFTINFAHRHPLLNVEVGGASVSYHIRGQAIDLLISDINKDGRITKEDKEIVLNLLETNIIKHKGGIGRYPWSMVVHFDVRGYKARWDKQH